jgi:hypothetical protein
MTRSSGRLTRGQRLLIVVLLSAAPLAVPHPAGREDDGTPAPAPPQTTQAAMSTLQPTSGPDAELAHAALAAEDQRLLTLVGSVRFGSGPYKQTVGAVDTLVLTPRVLGYGLPDLLALGAAEQQPDGGVLLTHSVFVAPGARLMIEAPGTSVRLRSEQSGFVSLVAWKATLVLAGADGSPLRVSSWDPGKGDVDSDVVDGRAYIRDVSGDMQLRDVNASHLGFWAGRTSGVAWTGSSNTVATGSIAASTFSRSHYGVFVSRGKDLNVTDSSFTANAVDGLSLHRGTVATTIRSSSSSGNGRHGFSADKGSESVAFTDVTAAGNAAHGIFFNGTPLTQGGSAGGASLRAYGTVAIVGGALRDNGKAGLRVVGGHDISVSGTSVTDNHDGIVLADTVTPTTVQDVVVTGGHRLGISVTGGSAAVAGNRVSGAWTAVRVRDAAVSVTGNVVTGATNHAVSVVGAAKGSSLVGNTISGRGPSGLDTYRLAPGVSVSRSDNDVEGWTKDRNDWAYWSQFVPNHPMLVLWVLVLGLQLRFAVPRRRRRIPVGTAPYPDVAPRDHGAPLRVDVGRPVTFSGPS